MVWYVAVIIETLLCGWVQLERRAIRRRQLASTELPPLHRAYGRTMERVRTAVKTRQRPKLSSHEARRRTGLATFSLITVGMLPMLAFVMLDGVHMSPALGQLIAWPLLWLAPVLTYAPARLGALLIAVWRGWLRLDDGDGGPKAAVPTPGSDPGSHYFRLAA